MKISFLIYFIEKIIIVKLKRLTETKMWFLFVKFSARLCLLYFFDKETRERIAQTDLSCALGDTEADKASHNRID